MAKKIFLVFSLIVFFQISFFNKPYNIDDWAFIRGGEVIGKRIFLHGETSLLDETIKCLGIKAKMYETSHPLFPFIFTSFLINTLKTEKELTFHLVFLIFILIAGTGLYFLSESLNLNYYYFSIILISTPIFFVNSLDVMSDIMGFAFFILGMSLFFTGKKGILNLILINIAFSIAIFSVYQSLILFFLVFLYALLFRKYRDLGVYVLILPTIVLISWLLYYTFVYHKFAFKVLYTHLNFRPISRGLSYFSYIGGASIFFPFLLIAFIKRWRDLGIYSVLWVFSIYISKNNAVGLINIVMLSLFLSTGFLVLYKIIEMGIKGIINSDKMYIFFSIWGVLYLLLAVIFLPFGAVRYTVYFLPPLIFFFMKESSNRGKVFYIATIMFTLISSVFIEIGNYQYSKVYKDVANNIFKKYTNSNIWFTGEWGFRWYMEEKGARYLLKTDNLPQNGDIVVIPKLPCPQILSDSLNARLYGMKSYTYNSKFPIRVMNREAKAGFYSDEFGLLPYSISTVPLEHILVFRVGGINYFFLTLKNAKVKTDVRGFKPVSTQIWEIKNIPKNVIFEHPTTSISYKIKIPKDAKLSFSIALKPDVWSSKKGDGVEFIIKLGTRNSELRTLFSKYIDPKNNPEDRKWHNEEVDLSEYGGKEITLTFITTCGPKGNCNYDWAGWGEPEITVNEKN